MSNIFYATFGQGSAFCTRYVKIQSETDELARAAMFQHFGPKWGFVYPADGFNQQIDQFALTMLCEIEVIDHGHGSHEFNII